MQSSRLLSLDKGLTVYERARVELLLKDCCTHNPLQFNVSSISELISGLKQAIEEGGSLTAQATKPEVTTPHQLITCVVEQLEYTATASKEIAARTLVKCASALDELNQTESSKETGNQQKIPQVSDILKNIEKQEELLDLTILIAQLALDNISLHPLLKEESKICWDLRYLFKAEQLQYDVIKAAEDLGFRSKGVIDDKAVEKLEELHDSLKEMEGLLIENRNHYLLRYSSFLSNLVHNLRLYQCNWHLCRDELARVDDCRNRQAIFKIVQLINETLL